ncbi:MAG TPA: AMP-binding protein [Ohtaekwangia sp.]|nr:AMP-binding protein [Ohtaekwangia sp.]
MNKFLPVIEFASPDEIAALQLEKLQRMLQFLNANSTFYKRHFLRHKVDVTKIQSLADLQQIPPAVKDDLQNFNMDFLCVPSESIAEYTSTSGTLGKPVTIALSSNDLERLAYNEAVGFTCADGSSADLYQLMLTLDRQFMAGVAYYQGIRKLNAGLIRVGPGVPAMQWDTILRLKPNTIVGVPSFMLKLVEYAMQNGIDVNATAVKKAICIGENIRTPELKPNGLASRITDLWKIKLFGTYASTEMQTAFTECSHGVGGHLHPELIIVEILDENNLPVLPGTEGEVTITTLGVEGMPLLRYKTGDIAAMFTDKCGCGRTTPRLGPVIGRKQQMLKLKGTTVYPPAIFDLLNSIENIIDYRVAARTTDMGTDEIQIHLVASTGSEEKTIAELTANFRSRLRVVPEIITSTPLALEKMTSVGSRKVSKFIDLR